MQKQKLAAGRGSQDHGSKKFHDKRKLQCYNCGKYGHFAVECWGADNSNNTGKNFKKDEAHLAQEDEDSDLDQVLLMATTNQDEDASSWYLDTGCSNHMTGNREWIIDFDSNVKNSVRFVNNSMISDEGIGKVRFTCKDGRVAYMNDVLYVPSMKNDLFSLGQLLEKGFKMSMEHNSIKIYDQKSRLVLKAPLSKNRTFKTNLNTSTAQCLSSIRDKEETNLVWHYRFGHLNFKSLNKLSSKQMVTGLPPINLSHKTCEGCLFGKQSRKNFKKSVLQRAKKPLEVVYSDVCGPLDSNSLGGNRYFLTFMDEFTRKIWIYLLKEKGEVFGRFVNFCAKVERESGYALTIDSCHFAVKLI